MTAKIIVVGSINTDLVTNTQNIPAPGETVIGGDLRTIPGGKGANQAVAAARMGAQVAMVGRVGNDVFAKQLKDNQPADGIDTTFITETTNTASGVALIVVDETRQNSIVVAPGANGRLSPTDIDKAKPAFTNADVLLLQLEIPMETVHHAAKLAAENDVIVILNPAPAQLLPSELLAHVDIPNESETATLTNLPIDTQTQLKTAVSQLHQFGPKTIIPTLGERGALLSQQGEIQQIEAFPAEKVVDTTAAGDSFVGALATAVAEGKSLAEALRRGTAAGAITVTRAGAQPSCHSVKKFWQWQRMKISKPSNL